MKKYWGVLLAVLILLVVSFLGYYYYQSKGNGDKKTEDKNNGIPHNADFFDKKSIKEIAINKDSDEPELSLEEKKEKIEKMKKESNFVLPVLTDGDIYIVNENKEKVRLTDTKDIDELFDENIDDNTIIFGKLEKPLKKYNEGEPRSYNVFTINIKTNQTKSLIENESVFQLIMSPDEKRMAYSTLDGKLFVIEAETNEKREVDENIVYYGTMVWDTKGERLAYEKGESGEASEMYMHSAVWIWESNTNQKNLVKQTVDKFLSNVVMFHGLDLIYEGQSPSKKHIMFYSVQHGLQNWQKDEGTYLKEVNRSNLLVYTYKNDSTNILCLRDLDQDKDIFCENDYKYYIDSINEKRKSIIILKSGEYYEMDETGTHKIDFQNYNGE